MNNEIQLLETTLRAANTAYRVGNPIMSDPDYDNLMLKLEELDPNNELLNDTGTLAVGIYTNTGNNPGSPNTRIASGTLSFSNADMDKKFIDITFTSPATLVANAFYWISISGEHDSGELVYLGFHNDYNGAYDTVKYQTSGFSASGGLPSTTSSLIDGEYAYWFRLYNPNAGLGAGKRRYRCTGSGRNHSV